MNRQTRRFFQLLCTMLTFLLMFCKTTSTVEEFAELRDSISYLKRISLKYIDVSECHLGIFPRLYAPYHHLDIDLQNLMIEFADTSLIGKESQSELLVRFAKFNGRYLARLNQITNNTDHLYLSEDAKAVARIEFVPRVFSYESKEVNSLRTYLFSLKRHLAILEINCYPTSDDLCYRNFPEHQEVSDLYLKGIYENGPAGNSAQCRQRD